MIKKKLTYAATKGLFLLSAFCFLLSSCQQEEEFIPQEQEIRVAFTTDAIQTRVNTLGTGDVWDKAGRQRYLTMKYAIIAAGEGSRLANEGIDVPKPLIKIQGVPMIERLVNIFAEHKASSISIIVNSRQPETVAKVKEMDSGCTIDLIVKDTAGSMHSFHELSQFIRGALKK